MATGNAGSSANVGTTSYRVTPGTAQNDRAVILSLWKEGGLGQQSGANDAALDMARFEWFYLSNPEGVADVYLLTHGDSDRPVGAMGIGPRKFSIAGATQLGGTLVDFVTHPKHRSAYPALLLQRRSRELALFAMRVVYGMPEAKAAAICRRLQSDVELAVPRFVRVVRAAPYLIRFVPKPLASLIGACVDAVDSAVVALSSIGSGTTGEWVHQFDERFDRLWSAVEKSGCVIGHRTATFLRWRFGQQPGRKHLIFTTRPRHSTELRSYFICEIDEGALVVKDCLTIGTSVEVANDLRLLIQAARRLSVKSVDLMLNANEEWQRGLGKVGFKCRSHRPFFATLSSGQPLPNGLRWYVTQADEDV